jgi:hypothetical protein
MKVNANQAMMSRTSYVPSDSSLPEDPLVIFPESASLDSETRNSMIAERAYYRAEARGFVIGHELEDWLAAESELNALLL